MLFRSNVRTIKNVPLKITFKGKLTVRGEGVMKQSVFAKLNEALIKAGDEPMSNPRNAAAGAIKLKDSRECAKRQLTFVAYQAIGFGDEFRRHRDVLAELTVQGFTVTTFAPVRRDCIEHIDDLIRDYRKTLDALDIDYDGIVFKADDFEERELLGFGSKYPRWGVAFK